MSAKLNLRSASQCHLAVFKVLRLGVLSAMEGCADNLLLEHGRQCCSSRVKFEHFNSRGREHDSSARVRQWNFFQHWRPLEKAPVGGVRRLLETKVDSVRAKDTVLVEIADERFCGCHEPT